MLPRWGGDCTLPGFGAACAPWAPRRSVTRYMYVYSPRRGATLCHRFASPWCCCKNRKYLSFFQEISHIFATQFLDFIYRSPGAWTWENRDKNLQHLWRSWNNSRQERKLCRTDETYLEELYPADTIFSPKMEKIDFKKKITVWNTAKETCPIRTESSKGAFVIFFSLNERAVVFARVLCVYEPKLVNLRCILHLVATATGCLKLNICDYYG